MTNKLLVVDFINLHPNNWEELLANDPYHLEIKWKDNYVLLKYNQNFSDFTNPLVRECRGLILKKIPFSFVNQGMYGIRFEQVCVPFFKFFNSGEPNAQESLSRIIDNSKYGLFVTEKVDGSLIKVWYDEGKWHVSTNGNIDANDAPLQFQTDELKTYYDLFLIAKDNSGLNYSMLDKQCTYMFELISPYNRIIVRYTDTKLVHLSTRNNITMLEEEQDILVEKSPKFVSNNIAEILEHVKTLNIEDNTNYEGFVVYDKDYNRIKIKSPKYLELFYLKGDGIYSNRKIINIFLKHEEDEILSYFPEYKKDFDKVGDKLTAYIEKVKNELWGLFIPHMDEWDRKTYAFYATKSTNAKIMFYALDAHNNGINVMNIEWLWERIKNIRLETLEMLLEDMTNEQ